MISKCRALLQHDDCIVKGCSPSKTFCLSILFASSRRTIRTSSVPSMKLICRVCPKTWAPWSYSPHPARPLVLRLWHHLRELTRTQKLVGFFSLNANISLESSLQSAGRHSLSTQPWFSLRTFRLISSLVFPTGVELHFLCVSNQTRTVGNDCECDSALYHKSGHRETSDLRWSRFSFFLFFFTWLGRGRLVEVPQWNN